MSDMEVHANKSELLAMTSKALENVRKACEDHKDETVKQLMQASSPKKWLGITISQETKMLTRVEAEAEYAEVETSEWQASPDWAYVRDHLKHALKTYENLLYSFKADAREVIPVPFDTFNSIRRKLS